MKFAVFPVLALATFALAAQVPQKAIIVTYPESTPDRVLEQAKDAIKAAGGMVTHEYLLIKGFAAKAPAKILESVSAWGKEYNAVIEEDQMVTVMGSGGAQ